MIETPGVIRETGAGDVDVLDRGIVDDLEKGTTIVELVVIEEIEDFLPVDETFTGAIDTGEETITGTMTSATTDV